MHYTASSLRDALDKAVENRLIICKTRCLNCPAANCPLYSGQCYNTPSSCKGNEKRYIHRIDVFFPGGGFVTLEVWYRIESEASKRDGFIRKKDEQLIILFDDRKIISRHDLKPI
jgi:hypothetical protein